jgi:hypothetical protein
MKYLNFIILIILCISLFAKAQEMEQVPSSELNASAGDVAALGSQRVLQADLDKKNLIDFISNKKRSTIATELICLKSTKDLFNFYCGSNQLNNHNMIQEYKS